jgi:hypothetical protein
MPAWQRSGRERRLSWNPIGIRKGVALFSKEGAAPFSSPESAFDKVPIRRRIKFEMQLPITPNLPRGRGGKQRVFSMKMAGLPKVVPLVCSAVVV